MKKDEHCPIADSLRLRIKLFVGVLALEKSTFCRLKYFSQSIHSTGLPENYDSPAKSNMFHKGTMTSIHWKIEGGLE